jgi:hypothetical protein
MKSTVIWQWGRLMAVAALVLLAVACGGGGGGDTSPPTDSSGTTTPGTTLPVGTTTTGTPSLLDPAIISRAGEGGNYPPMVAIDNAGNAIALWVKEGSSPSFSYELLARRYVAGSGWQDVQSLAGPTSTEYLDSPVLSVDKTTGKAMVVWAAKRRAPLNTSTNIITTDIMARAYDPATGWAAPVAVDGDKPILGAGIALATDASGNVMAAWNRYEGQKNNLYASRYTSAAGTWAAPVSIENNDEFQANDYGAQLAFAPNGDALVVWKRSVTTGAIWGNKYTAGPGWGTNVQIEMGSGVGSGSGPLRFVDDPVLAVDGNGNAILTYTQQLFVNPTVGYEVNIRAKRYTGGAWSASSAPVGTPYNCSNCPIQYPARLQANAQGAAVATWMTQELTAAGAVVYKVHASRSNSGGAWEPQVLNNNLPEFLDTSLLPDAGIDSAGNISVVWSPSTGNNSTNIYNARYTAGTGWGAAELLESYTGTAQLPRIAMNERGNAMTVWMQFDNAIGTVIASRYYSSGR